MQLSLPMKRLLWKDVLQVLPLLLVLIGVSAFIHLLFVFSSSLHSGEIEELIRSMLIAIPMCYSIGIAAVSISIEKENNQMLWLNGLPIAGNQVAGSKLVVIFAGWFIIWLVSLVIYESIHILRLGLAIDLPRYEFGLIGFTGALSGFIVQSFLMLTIGVMVAWRLQTAWIAIVAMLLMAMIPFHTQVLYVLLVQNQRWLRSGNELVCTLIAAAFSVLFLVAGWRFAKQYWARELPRVARTASWTERTITCFPDWTQTTFKSSTSARYSPSSALLWRIGQQHFSILAILFGVVLTALVAVAIFVMVNKRNGFDPFPLFTVVMAFVGCGVVSWTGWLVFRTESHRHSIRFLAERGLSPSRLWWTQQCVPFAFLCLLALTILVAIRLFFPATHQWTWLSQGVLRQFLFLLLIYSLSQWISFVIPKPVFGAIVAPLVGTLLAIYLWIESGFIYPNPWVAAVLIAFPFIVTRIYFRSWMDGRRSWWFWAGQVGCLILLLCVPQISHLSPLWNPAMPSHVRSKISAEALTLVKQPQTSVTFLPYLKLDPDVLTQLREMFSGKNEPVKWELPNQTLTVVVGDIVSARVQIRKLETPTRFQSLQKPSADDSEKSANATKVKLQERYNESIGFVLKIVSLLRQSARITDQDRADWLEMFLLRESLQKNADPLLTNESYNRIVDRIRDHDVRYQARRRAILLSWHRAWTKPEENELIRTGMKRKLDQGPSLGGYWLHQDSRWNWRNPFFNAKLHKADHVTYEMLECLERGRIKTSNDQSSSRQPSSLSREEIQRRIAVVWSGSSDAFDETYGWGLGTVRETDYSSPESPLHHAFIHGSTRPGDQWYGEWERAAARLEKRGGE